MRNKLPGIVVGIAILTALATSCMKNDDVVVSFSPDASIQEIGFDTIITSHVLSPTVTTRDTIFGTDYPFVIDQNNATIYNLDSLPKGTSVSSVRINVYADTEYVTYAERQDSLWLNTDYIDFTTPLKLRVYSYAGAFGRTYTVSINVHKVHPDSMTWSCVEGEMPESLLGYNSQYVAYPLRTNPSITREITISPLLTGYTSVMSKLSNESEWTTLTTDTSLAMPALHDVSVFHFNDALYAFGGVGVIDTSLTGFEHFYVSNDNGISWQVAKHMAFPQSLVEAYTGKDMCITAAKDDDDNIWIALDGVNKVWRGKLNKLTFANR